MTTPSADACTPTPDSPRRVMSQPDCTFAPGSRHLSGFRALQWLAVLIFCLALTAEHLPAQVNGATYTLQVGQALNTQAQYFQFSSLGDGFSDFNPTHVTGSFGVQTYHGWLKIKTGSLFPSTVYNHYSYFEGTPTLPGVYRMQFNVARANSFGQRVLTPWSFTVIVPNAQGIAAISPITSSFAAGGGTGSFSVTATTGWTAAKSASWITLNTGSGSGNGSVSYSVAANTAMTSRTGTITVGTFTHTITQAAVPVVTTLNPISANVLYTGVSGNTISVTSNASWTATPNVSWIRITGGGSGGATGTVTYSVDARTDGSQATRSGQISFGNSTFTVTQNGNGPFTRINPGSQSVTSDAGTGFISVSSNTTWAVSKNATWVTITSAGSGSGNGNVQFSYTANPTTTARSASITVGTESFFLNQAGIPLFVTLSPASVSLPNPAATGTIAVTSNTTWTTTASQSWITITSGASGSMNGSVAYSVATNTGANARTGNITVRTTVFTITQAGLPRTTLSPTGASVPYAGVSGNTIAVTSNTTWAALPSAPWLRITAGGTGTGNGTVTYTVDARTDGSMSQRTGQITIGGTTFSVSQAGGTAATSISPTAHTIGAEAGPGTLSVISNTAWTAAESVEWLSLTGGASGVGNGTVRYTVTANPAMTARSGVITVAGLEYTLTQAAAAAATSVSPASLNPDHAGGPGSLDVASNTTWTATASPSWITITSGASGSQNGTVAYTVAINASASARTGSLTVNGIPIPIIQSGNSLTVSEISVQYPAGTELVDGVGGASLGHGLVGVAGAPRDFIIRNVGTRTLSGISVSISGDNAAEFALSTAPPSSVAAGASATFRLTFSPTAKGTRTAQLRLASNDADENPFDLPLTGQGHTPLSIAQTAYLKAGNNGPAPNSSAFGSSVAISGDIMVIGAPSDNGGGIGVNPAPWEDLAVNSGAAYVYVRDVAGWTLQAHLKASNAGANDSFGDSVALSGNTLVVGAPGEDGGGIGVNPVSDDGETNAGAAYVFLRTGTTWTQQAYLKASNRGGEDAFGGSVAVSGDTLVVGSPGEDSSHTGVNSSASNESANAAGAGYVFVRSGNAWTQQAYLKASNTGADDVFGTSVAVAGNTVVIGAPLEDGSGSGVNPPSDDNAASSGAAYVFVRSGTAWSQQAYLKASNPGILDKFGTSVAASGDTIVVGSPYEGGSGTGVNPASNDDASSAGAVYVYLRSGTAWNQQAYLKASNTSNSMEFGTSVAVSGNTVVIGAEGERGSGTGINPASNLNFSEAGAAYVFVSSGTTWTQQAYLKASNTGHTDLFGHAVAVSGDYVVAGAYKEDGSGSAVNSPSDDLLPDAGAAYLYRRDGTVWSHQAYLKAPGNRPDMSKAWDHFGHSVAVYGNTVAVASNTQINVFVLSGTTWMLQATFDCPGCRSMALSGSNLIAGSPNATGAVPGSGAVYVYGPSGTSWSQLTILRASNGGDGDRFGHSVALSGSTLVVGAPSEDGSGTGINPVSNENAASAGAVYVFTGSGATWSQQAYLKASNTGAGDNFGQSVAVSGNTVVVGAYTEDGSGTGVNPATNENASSAGAAYVFVRSGTAWSHQAYLKASSTGTNSYFGSAVAAAGESVVVGARGARNASVFVRSGTAWSQQALLWAPTGGEGFGSAVAMFGDTAVIGAPNSGEAYRFTRSGTTWSQGASLKAFNTGASDQFGSSVAVSESFVVIGAPYEDGSGAGVNPVSNNLTPDSGAAYLFSAVFPNIAVEQPAGSLLVDGTSSVDFGSVATSESSSRTFTLSNLGRANLTGISLVIEGADAAAFRATSLPSVSLGSTGSSTFQITFTASSAGSTSAWLRISSNDAYESPFDIALTGTGVPPDITVEYPAGTSLVDGGPGVAFGTVVAGATASRTFTMRNDGTVPMTGISISFDGGNIEDFTLTAAPPDMLPPGGTAVFTVAFSPGRPGSWGTALRIASSDSDEAPFDIALTGTGTGPEINVVTLPNGTALADGYAHIGFGSAESGEVVTRSFRLNSTGAVALTGLSVGFAGAHPGDFAVTTALPATVAPGGNATLVVAFSPLATGPRTAELRIASDDADENPFVVHLSATGMTPDITVVHPAGSPRISGAGEVDFGIRKTGEASAAKTFTIQNEGVAALQGIVVSVAGAAAGDFTVNTTGMAASLAVGATTAFSVTFNPAAPLSRRATLRIASNDRDENPFEVLLRGTGLNASNSLAFVPLGDYPGGTFGSSVWGLSGDGTIVVGSTETSVGQQAFRWTQAQGMTLMPWAGKSLAGGISRDGTVITGAVTTGTEPVGVLVHETTSLARWTGDTVTLLGELGGGQTGASGNSVAADGSVIFGWTDGPRGVEPLRWTASEGITGLGYLPTGETAGWAFGYDSSDDGAIAVGSCALPGAPGSQAGEAFRWTAAEGMRGLGFLAGPGGSSAAYAVSGEGAVVVGQSIAQGGRLAFRWTAAGGMEPLGDLDGGIVDSSAWGISSDGRTIVGMGRAADGNRPVLWNAATGMVDIKALLEMAQVAHTGWSNFRLDEISDDGDVLAGNATNPSGRNEGFIIKGVNSALPQSDIAVSQNGTDLTSGVSTISFGDALFAGQSATRNFSISNTGNINLSNIAVQISGGAAFQLNTTGTLATLAPLATTGFSVSFAPVTPGTHTATLSIDSSDPDEAPFTLVLQGVANAHPFHAAASAAGLTGGNVLPEAMPFGDGVANLLKYAFNLNLAGLDNRPLTPGTGTAGLPATTVQGTPAAPVLRVEFLRRKGSGLNYTPTKSEDLSTGTWLPLTDTPTVTSLDATWERVVYEEPVTGGSWFARVQVALP